MHKARITRCKGHTFLSCTCGQHLGKILSTEQSVARFEQHLVEAGKTELADHFAAFRYA